MYSKKICSVTAPKDAMRKHHKKWNVVQSGHCTVVLLHLVAATGRQHHCTVTCSYYLALPDNLFYKPVSSSLQMP